MSKTKDKPLKGFGVRADEDKMKTAHLLKIDTGDLFRRALDAEILKRKGKCPTCGVTTEQVGKWTRKIR